MELIRSEDVPRGAITRTFRHSPVGAAVMLAIWVGLAVFFAVVFGPRALDAGWVVLALATPVVVVGGLVWLLVLSAMWMAFASCFGASNWVMKVSERGVYLKVRSYMNHHFPEDGPTVARIGFDEIVEARKVTIRSERECGHERRVEIHPYLELRLKHGETDELHGLCVREMSRKPPRGRFSSVRANHAPVVVPEAGMVRCQWLGRGMLRVLGQSVAIGEKFRIDRGSALKAAPQELDGMILEAVEAGRKIEAIQLIRQRYPEMGLAQAKRFAEDLLAELDQSAA